jgi:hypothetical protein
VPDSNKNLLGYIRNFTENLLLMIALKIYVKHYLFFFLCLYLYLNYFLSATVILPAFFSDGMVLQQQTDAALWGWAKAGAIVKINTSWNKKNYTTTADANGKWMIKVATPVAGGPYYFHF